MKKENYNETELTELVKAMRQRTIIMDREGTFWTDEEKRFLKNSFDHGEDPRVVAVKLHRTEEAIWKQMEKLYRQARPHKSKAGKCLCHKCKVKCDNYRKS